MLYSHSTDFNSLLKLLSQKLKAIFFYLGFIYFFHFHFFKLSHDTVLLPFNIIIKVLYKYTYVWNEERICISNVFLKEWIFALKISVWYRYLSLLGAYLTRWKRHAYFPGKRKTKTRETQRNVSCHVERMRCWSWDPPSFRAQGRCKSSRQGCSGWQEVGGHPVSWWTILLAPPLSKQHQKRVGSTQFCNHP